MAKQAEITIPELTPPELPYAVAYLWDFYVEARSMSDQMTITTIKEYGSLIGVEFAMYEVQALCAIARVHNKAMQI